MEENEIAAMFGCHCSHKTIATMDRQVVHKHRDTSYEVEEMMKLHMTE